MIPSQQTKENLDKLSKEFKPDHVSYTLGLNQEFSLVQVSDEVEGAIRRLKAFVENGHSCEGLDFKFENVRTFNSYD